MREVKSADFRQRPLLLKGLNKIWKSSYPLGTKVKLDKDQIIKAARKKTGLKELGKDFWDEPLEVLLKSVNEEARLHPIGRFITRERLTNLVAVRLRAEDWFKKHPEILEQALYPVLLIAGLQRTGTTKLQRLLSADPEARPLYSWEALNPAPFDANFQLKDARIQAAKTAEQALKYMSPNFFAIHPVEHRAPEEDILLLDVSFLSTTAEATMRVPTYAAWLEKNDQEIAYSYAAKLLKLLQWQRPGKRWVLKSPHHLEFLSTINRVFDKVHFIWTHREVYQCMASFLSMVAHGRAIFSDDINIKELTNHWLRKMGYMLEKGIAFREQQGHAIEFTDVHYQDFLEAPLATIQHIYRNIGAVSPNLQSVFETHEANSQSHKYGRHRYQLADFGIDRSDIDQYTKRYQAFLATLKQKST